MLSYQEALQDFLYSEIANNTKPSIEVCKSLIKHERFVSVIQQANKDNIKRLSFCSEGNGEMVIIYDPVYIGACSTNLTIELDDGYKIDVWFDRN